MSEAITLDFTNISSDEVQRISTSRSTKYTELVGACLGLNPGQAIRVPVPEGEPASKMRINISNAVRTRLTPAWKADSKNQHVRIVRGADEKGSYIAIVCHEGIPAPRKPRTAPAAKPAPGKAKVKSK